MSSFSVATVQTDIDGHACNTCKALFSSVDKVKEHYRGDWHVFNSKRRASGLVPLSKEEFKRLSSQLAARKAPGGGAASSSSGSSSSSSSSSSVASSTHTRQSKAAGGCAAGAAVPLSWGGITADSAQELRDLATKMGLGQDRLEGVVELALERQQREVAARSLKAQSRKDEMVAEGLTGDGDVEGDEGEEGGEEEDEEEEEVAPPLGANISIFDDKEFATVDECVQYMSTAFGFYLPDTEYLTDREGLLEYLGEKVKLGGICLYCQKQLRPGRSCQDHMTAKSHCKIAYVEGVDMEEFEDFYDFEASYEGLPLDEEGNPIEAVAHVSPIGELILPDGRIAGHRAFKVYYKQYFSPAPSHPGVLAQQREELLRIGGQVGLEQSRQDIVAMPDTQVMALLVKYHKEIRRNQMVQQRAKQRVEMVAKRKENRNRAQQQLSSQKTTEKIRDYHGMLM